MMMVLSAWPTTCDWDSAEGSGPIQERTLGFCESGGQSRLAKGENALHIRSDKEAVRQSPSPDGILQIVFAQGSAVFRDKRVGMDPSPERPPQLVIAKSKGRIPFENPGPPPKGNASESDPVIDQGVDTHDDGTLGHDLELQPGWSEQPQVSGIGEKRENFLQWAGQPLFGREGGHEESEGAGRCSFGEVSVLVGRYAKNPSFDLRQL